MKQNDKAILINQSRLDTVSLSNRAGGEVVLYEPLTDDEICDRPSLNGEEAWWVYQPVYNYNGGKKQWFIPVSCLQVVGESQQWMENNEAILVNPTRLKDVHMDLWEGVRVKLIKPLTAHESKTLHEMHGTKGWWVKTVRQDGYKTFQSAFVPESCLERVGSSNAEETNTTTITIKQKETENMSTIAVRMKTVPTVAAKEHGAVDKILVPVTEVLAKDTNTAIALVAARKENADKINTHEGELVVTATVVA